MKKIFLLLFISTHCINLFAQYSKKSNQENPKFEVALYTTNNKIYGDISGNNSAINGKGLMASTKLYKNFHCKIQTIFGKAAGLNTRPTEVNAKDVAPWANIYGLGSIVYYNYFTKLNQFNFMLEYKTNFNRKINFGFATGIGKLNYITKINALNYLANYKFSNLNESTDIKSDYKFMLDKTYETAVNYKKNNNNVITTLPIDISIQYKLNKNISLLLYNNFNYTANDYIDGQRYYEANRELTPNDDFINYIGLGILYKKY